jgi:hypothetical protein
MWHATADTRVLRPPFVRGVMGRKDRKGERGMREERKESGATEKWGARKGREERPAAVAAACGSF